MAVVLVIEDELVLRESMARALERLANVQVVTAGLLSEAQVALASEAPTVIVSDINLPDGNGVDILKDIEQQARRIPVIFVSAWLDQLKEQIPKRDDIEVFEKPLPTEKLRSRVQYHIERSRARAPAPFSVADYLQLAAMGRHSTLLRLARGRSQVGWLRVLKGEVWSAHFEGSDGEEAAGRAVVAEGLRVEVEPWEGEPGLRNVHQSTDHLLLEAFRQHDEAVRDAGGPTSNLEARDTIDLNTRKPAASFDSLMDEGLDALLSRDYETAWRAFSEADNLKPGNPVVRANLNRIRQLGRAPEAE